MTQTIEHPNTPPKYSCHQITLTLSPWTPHNNIVFRKVLARSPQRRAVCRQKLNFFLLLVRRNLFPKLQQIHKPHFITLFEVTHLWLTLSWCFACLRLGQLPLLCRQEHSRLVLRVQPLLARELIPGQKQKVWPTKRVISRLYIHHPRPIEAQEPIPISKHMKTQTDN